MQLPSRLAGCPSRQAKPHRRLAMPGGGGWIGIGLRPSRYQLHMPPACMPCRCCCQHVPSPRVTPDLTPAGVGLLLPTAFGGGQQTEQSRLAFHHFLCVPPRWLAGQRAGGVDRRSEERGTPSIGRGEALLFAYEPTPAGQPGCPGRSLLHAEQRVLPSEATQRPPIDALIYRDDSHWCLPPGGLAAIRTAGNDASRVWLPIGWRSLGSARRMLPYARTLLYGHPSSRGLGVDDDLAVLVLAALAGSR